MASFKVFGSVIFVLSLISCGPTNTTNYESRSISQGEYANDGVLSSSVIEIVELNEASKKVSIKPMMEVREYNGCSEVHKFRYSTVFSEDAVLITARNDAISLGGDTISILDFNNDKNKNIYTIGLYKCS